MKEVCFVIDDRAAATNLEDDEAVASDAPARPKISVIIAWAKARWKGKGSLESMKALGV